MGLTVTLPSKYLNAASPQTNGSKPVTPCHNKASSQPLKSFADLKNVGDKDRK